MTSIKSIFEKPMEWRGYLPGVGVFEREARRFFTVPVQTLGAPLGSALLYFAVFHFSLGRIVNQSAQAEQTLSLGVDYLHFLIPGIMSLEMVNASFQNPVSSLLISKWNGNIIDQLMAPLDAFSTWCGYIAGALVRTLVVATATYTAGALFSWSLFMHNIFTFVLACVLITGIFGSIGMIAGVLCKTFDQVGMIGSFIIQPLMFLSGVFFSLSQLSERFGWLPYLNPAFYIVNMVRYSLIGIADIPPTLSYSVSACFCLVLASVAIVVIRKGKGLRT